MCTKNECLLGMGKEEVGLVKKNVLVYIALFVAPLFVQWCLAIEGNTMKMAQGVHFVAASASRAQ